MTEVRVLFPPNKEIADLQTIICAVAMRSTRTKEPAHELQNDREWIANCHCKALRENSCMTISTHLKCDFYDRCAERMLRQAKKMKHWGVFEHATFTVSVSGISRVLTHQLVRHRIGSYLQQSSRHVKPSGGILPQSIWNLEKTNKELYLKIVNYVAEGNVLYDELVENGIPKEDARFILTEGSQTHIVITFNARQWLHFFHLRLSKNAQWEIKEMAQKILDEFMKLSPIIFEGAGELEV
jgi:thymidylate synthase (FAD)